MKSFHVHGFAIALGWVCLTASAVAQQHAFGSPALLPLPQGGFRQAAHLWQQEAPAPPTPDNSPMQDPSAPATPPMSPSEGPVGAGVEAQSQSPPAMPPVTGAEGAMVQGSCGCADNCCGSCDCEGGCGRSRWGLLGLGRYHWCQPVRGHGFPGPGIINPIVGHFFDLHYLKHGGYTAGCGGSCDCGCNSCGDCGPCGCNPCDCNLCNCCPSRCGWFGGLSGLIMTRDNGNHYHFSVENTVATEHIQLLDTRDADMDWSGGFEARIGRYCCCGTKGWELLYWGIFPDRQEFSLFGADFAGPLDGILDWDQISIDDPRAAGAATNAGAGWVDNADAHRVRRDYDFHNVEVNMLNFSGCLAQCGCAAPRFSYQWGAGVRFFRFTEDLLFSAKTTGTGTAFDEGLDQLDYLVDIENNLVGGQIGGQGTYCLTSKLSLNFGAKVGLFGNHMNHRSLIQSAGTVAYVNNGPFDNADWRINSSKNDVAMLGEATIGLDYQINCRLSATLGYRALGITGVALSSNQIPSDLRGINDAAVIDSNGSMILHGGFGGIEWNY